MSRHAWGRITFAVILLFAAGLSFVLFQKLRPYDAIRFVPNSGTVTPAAVPEGGTITISRDSFCNDGYDITVERWADRLDPDGTVTASLGLPPVQFFTDVPVCIAPSDQPVILPNYIPAVMGEPTKYRLRFVTSYQPNIFRTVTVTSFTEPFTITGPREAGE